MRFICVGYYASPVAVRRNRLTVAPRLFWFDARAISSFLISKSFSILFHIPLFLPCLSQPFPPPLHSQTPSWQANGSHEILQRSCSRKCLLASYCIWIEDRHELQNERIRCPIYSCVFILPQSRLVLRKTTPALGQTLVNLWNQIQQCPLQL